MKYRITVGVEIDIHPHDRECHEFTDLMNAFREGIRMNCWLASKVQDLRLMKCKLIEPVAKIEDGALNKRGEM